MDKLYEKYKAGNCNIGQKEVRVRKKFFYFFLALSVALTFSSYYDYDSLAVWIGLLISTFAVSVLYLEICFRFCILFGYFNLYNFYRLGNLHEVKEKEDGKKDRKRAMQIVMQALLASLGYSTAVHMLVMYFHI